MCRTLSLTQNGWPGNYCAFPWLKPYFTRKHELLVEQGCLMWGLRTITPPVFEQLILSVLHEAHPDLHT